MNLNFKNEWTERLSKCSETELFKLTWTRALLGGETSYIAWDCQDDDDVLVDMDDRHPLKDFLVAVVFELLWRGEQKPDAVHGNLLALDVHFLEQKLKGV